MGWGERQTGLEPDPAETRAVIARGLHVSATVEIDELRAALRDIRLLLLDGLDEPEPQRDYLREIAKVMSRPTIARFTRGT